MLTCVSCGEKSVIKNGSSRGYKKYRCKSCGCLKKPVELRGTKKGLDSCLRRNEAPARGGHGDNVGREKPEERYRESGDSAELIKVVGEKVKSLEDLIRVCSIDTDNWDVVSWECGTYQMPMKLKDAEGVEKGTVTTLYKVNAKLKRNTEKIILSNIKSEIIEEIKQYKPDFSYLDYKSVKGRTLLEIDIPDAHFGKHTWKEESGDNYDIEIAEEVILAAVYDLLEKGSVYKPERILFPAGNDFFNVDNMNNTTTAGTKQQEDTRWQKTFRRGRQLLVKMIDAMLNIAPVDVLIVPGNHDVERAFYVGDSLEAFYYHNKNVSVNNSASKRKYYKYGNTLLGFTHGKYEKANKLPMVMAQEQAKLWSEVRFREWHLGDKHHKMTYETFGVKEDFGVVVRYLRSLSALDAWHYDHAYVGSNYGAEAMIFDVDDGCVGNLFHFGKGRYE